MRPFDILAYYSREDVQAALLSMASGREVAGVYGNGSFGPRPNVIIYPQDITTMVKKGVVEFHCSLERWSRPMALKSETYQTYANLRSGWDLVLDIDCKVTEHGKIAARVLLDALKKHGLRSYYIKFTGGTGFHIGIPWESVPDSVDFKPSVSLFPDLARQIGLYLKEFTREKLERRLLKRYMPTDLAEQVGKPLGQMLKGDTFDPFQVVDIDPILISPRHLFRMPYSLHRTTGLVSRPISEDELDDFKKESAKPGLTKAMAGFLTKAEPGEAEFLISESVEWHARQKRKEEKRLIRKAVLQDAVPLELAPPCIKLIMEGLPDGRKRALFILLNYLSSTKWKWENIESSVEKWNSKNKPPLQQSYVRSQLRWHRAREGSKPPPNCNNEGWMIGIGVCKPDNICGWEKRSIKNPVNYPLKKMKPAYTKNKRKQTK